MVEMIVEFDEEVAILMMYWDECVGDEFGDFHALGGKSKPLLNIRSSC